MTSSPDLTPYIDLRINDLDAQDVYEAAVQTLQSRLPTWVPREDNTEVMLLEALALETAETIFAINRLPNAIMVALMKLHGIERDEGAAPTVTVRFTAVDSFGYTINAGTRISLDLPGGLDPIVFTTRSTVTIPDGSYSVTATAIGSRFTDEANGIPAGTSVDLLDVASFMDTVELASEVTGGRGPEDDAAWLTRGVQRFRRLVETLATPAHFTAAALENPAVTRAVTLDLYNANDPNIPDDGILVSDAFARTIVSGWGNADVGGAWVVTGGSVSSVDGASGVLHLNYSSALSGARVPGAEGVTVTTSFMFSATRLAVGNPIKVVARARITSSGEYRPTVHLRSDGGIDVSIARSNAAGTETVIFPVTSTGLTYAANTKIRIKAEAVDTGPTTIRFKVWLDGTSEPGSWTYSVTDNTAALQAAGHTGVYASRSGSDSGSNMSVLIDEYLSTSPLPPGPPQPAPGHVTVVVYGQGDTVDSETKQDLLLDMQSKALANLSVHVIDPTFVYVDVDVQIKVLPGYAPHLVLPAVAEALRQYMSPETWPWESVVRRNELIALISNVPGVDYVADLVSPAADIELQGVATLAVAGGIEVSLV